MIAKLLGPRMFDIEATDNCNVDCVFCPRKEIPTFGAMSVNTFENFLKNVPLRPQDALTFIGIGEPLLNPHLPQFVELTRARYPRLFISITSNGTALTPKSIPRLLAANLNQLDVSFNGLKAEIYESLMKGAHFERTLSNIDYTLNEIERTGSQTILQINYILTQENSGQKEEIESFWRSRGVKQFRGQEIHTRADLVHVEGMTPMNSPGLHGHSCNKFEYMPFISWQGDVHYCSHDIPRQHKLGNICEDAWDVIEQRRKDVIKKSLWPDMCSSCDDCSRFKLEGELSDSMTKEIKKRFFKILK